MGGINNPNRRFFFGLHRSTKGWVHHLDSRNWLGEFLGRRNWSNPAVADAVCVGFLHYPKWYQSRNKMEIVLQAGVLPVASWSNYSHRMVI